MTWPSIRAVGAYAPRFYISSETFADVWDRHEAAGIERCAVPDADEDALTMAWEAAQRALTATDHTPDDVAYLGFATSTPPIDEEDLSVRLGSMLGVPSRARQSYRVGSTLVGTQSLCEALDAGPWGENIGLVVAADAPRGELTDAAGHGAGAGAGALILGDQGPGSIISIGHGSAVAPGERYRSPESTTTEGLGITAYDRRAYRETIVDAVNQLGEDHTNVDAAAIQAPDGARPYRLASTLALENETIYHGTTVQDLGNTGAASVPLGLARALAGGGERFLAVGYGAGAGADALLIEAPSMPLQTSIEPDIELDYPAYLRRRGALTGGEPDGGGAYVSMPSWVRSLPQRQRLEAGRCVACGALALPATGSCTACGEGETYETVRLSGDGTIEAVTTISSGGAPPEFDAYQQRVGAYQTAVVAFDGQNGDAVSLPVMVTADDSVSVGDRVTAVMRRIFTQERLPRYGLKVTLA